MIHRATAKSDWYYPTSLAIGLSSGKSESLGGGATQRFIIVETTFKVTANASRSYFPALTSCQVYAYTASPLQIALLGMFVGLEARLPNLIVGMKSGKKSFGDVLLLCYICSTNHEEDNTTSAFDRYRGGRDHSVPSCACASGIRPTWERCI